MIVYAESSAVLAWLLGEPTGEPARSALAGAELVVTSRLTLVECGRAIHRARRTDRLDDKAALAAEKLLDHAADTWVIMDLVGDVPARAARAFPREPIRTLDALHLASAAVFHQALGAVRMLSLDERIRDSAGALGLEVLPAPVA